MQRPKLVIFASGTDIGGGSGFENLVKSPELDADIVGVVSNHEHGGVQQRAQRLGVPFIYFQCGTSDVPHREYRRIFERSGAQWIALSGWMKKVVGLDSAKTFNIHPALLSFDHGRLGGKGMYGHHIHDAVKAALDAGEISESGFTMHFVTADMDHGPAFFEYRVPLQKGMSTEDIAKAVNIAEHQWQPRITNMVVHGLIRWDGEDPKSLVVSENLSIG